MAIESEAISLVTPGKRTKTIGAQPHRSKPSSNIAGKVESSSTIWSKRIAQRQQLENVKQKQREMQSAKEQEIQKRKEIRNERVRKQQEKQRLEEMASKMSRKKLDRKRRRMGLTKKISH